MTDWNAKRKSQGHVDVPLNKTGEKQAAALARYLAAHHFDAIYSSDFSRTVESIKPLAEKVGLEIKADWRLREGRWPHQSNDEPEYPILPFFSNESEKHEDVLARLVTFLDEVLKEHPEGRVMIMTHGSVLTRLLFHLEGYSKWPFPPFRMQKMAVNILSRNKDDCWDAIRLNDSDYLAESNLLIGRQRSKKRQRLIVYNLGLLSRKLLPRFLHPPVQKVLRHFIDKDRKLSINPYHELSGHPAAKKMSSDETPKSVQKV